MYISLEYEMNYQYGIGILLEYVNYHGYGAALILSDVTKVDKSLSVTQHFLHLFICLPLLKFSSDIYIYDRFHQDFILTIFYRRYKL